jgi:divalent metal cation (Fe/Co/Zn/Cd) transporter
MFVRKIGPKFYIDLHLDVDPKISVREGHKIGHAVKDATIAQSRDVADVLVHIEPGPVGE